MTITAPETDPESFEVPPDVFDNTEQAAASARRDKPPRFCKFEGCTNELTQRRNGSYPVYCETHRPAGGRPAGSSTGTPKNNTGKWTRGERLETSLGEMWDLLVVGASLFPPTAIDAPVLDTYGPRIIHELVMLARDDAKLLAQLEKLATPGKYGPLTIAVGSMVFAIAANHGILQGLFNRFTQPRMSAQHAQTASPAPDATPTEVDPTSGFNLFGGVPA